MSKRKTAPAAKRGGATAFEIDELIAMNQRSINAMTQMNTQVYENLMRVHASLLDFTSRRLRADIEVAKKLTGSGKLDDAVEAVQGFQRQMISDYADEAREIVKMCTSMAGDPIQEVEGDIEEGAGEGDFDVKRVIQEFQRKMREISSNSADEASEIVKASTSMAGDLLIREIEDQFKAGGASSTDVVATKSAAPKQQAAETDEEVAAKGPIITLKASPNKTSSPDLQKVILDVLSGADEALALTEVARRIGTVHYAALIGPMGTLRKLGRVVKEDKLYRLA